MKFIHCADLHIDSPMLGLEAYEGAPVDRIRQATRDSFENIIELAIAEQVAFVIIAGDLFDGSWQDMQTGLWTANQFRRLQRAEIPVYMIRGNHDAESVVRSAMTWPDNVFEFSTRKPETILLEQHDVALHGQGFANRSIPEDLTPAYPDPIAGLFNIGLLHTSLEGNAAHATYAPTTVAALRGKGYDYWALGHIHKRELVGSQPAIHYPGNAQGRHIHESGAKGCLLNTVEDRELVQSDFVATDVLRWAMTEVSMEPEDRLHTLIQRVHQAIGETRSEQEGRMVAIRLRIAGACEAHRDLTQPVVREDTVLEIRNLANEFDGVWIEKIQFATSLPVDLESIRNRPDLLGELLRSVDSLRLDASRRTLVRKDLEAVLGKCEQAGLTLDDDEHWNLWLLQVEQLLVEQLVLNPGESS